MLFGKLQDARRQRPRSGIDLPVRLAAVVFMLALGTLPALAIPEQPPYPHGEFEDDCSICHSANGWVPAAISARFDHQRSGFALDGAHAATDCRSCHRSLEFQKVESACVSCHQDVHRGEFGIECASCHTTSSFIDRAVEIRSHQETRFPLRGAHVTVDCTSCHPSQPQGGLRFVNTPGECESCHLADFTAAKEPDHVALGFDRDCQQCHSSTVWDQGRFDHFDHAATGFPLTGSHTGLSCQQCHVGGTFVALPNDCNSCHGDDYLQAPNHVAGNFPRTCENCHSTNSWSGGTFDHSFFPFVGGHSGLECTQCHTSGVTGTIPADCVSCHQGDYQQAPGHSTGGYPTTCEDCHTVNTWAGASFDHGFFPLTAGHGGLTCEQCHTGGTFEPMPTDCLSCHTPEYVNAPSHVASNFPQTCESCHSITTWADATYDHGFYPLTGAHAALDCAQCHTSGSYATIPGDCISCHQTDYQQAPNHLTGNFPTTCEECHTTTVWTGASFDHGFFPLTSGHGGLTCEQCHTSGTFDPMPTDCLSCHTPEYVNAPSHVASNFPQTCENCHSITTWADATYDHGFYPLVGAHAALDCAQCHTSGSYLTIPGDCISCHQTDYQQAPGHVTGSFPTTCDECHTLTTWTAASFDHSFFPLTSGHGGLTCDQCHTNGSFEPMPTDCLSCHTPEYVNAPSHVASNFPQTCENCHSITTWADAIYDHGFYPLVGAHAALDCVQCHTSGSYLTIPGDCISCHQTDYQQAPGHVTGSFPTTCDECHTLTTWTGASFDHSFFPLNAGHGGLTCDQCHTNGNFDPMPTDCLSCHTPEYVSAPSHVASNFSQTCENCHSVTIWADATFDHGFYPLTGTHTALDCVQCHTSGIYATIPGDCISCHQSDYQQAPGHVTSNFPTTCEECHTTTVWTGATFDHGFFPLSGGHGGLTCIDCHTNGNYDPLPTDCYSCHRTDYDQAPDHLGLQFSHDCESCHAITTWIDVSFVHPWPLVGPHRDRLCSDCHNFGTVQEFSCLGACHQHTAQKMADKHSGTNGYAYDFPLCVACHANGRG